MVLKIAFSVDDIAPIPEHGLNKEKGNLKYLIKLNEEFGAKFTLFTIPNFQGKNNILDHKDWFNWLKEKEFFEIGVHGYFHMNPNNPDLSIEFININKQQATTLIKNSLQTFNELGIRPSGFKFPGWEFDPEFMDLITNNFDYLADHFVGVRPLKMSNGFVRIPYTLSAENLHSNHYKDDVLIIHSHIAVDKQNKNGFTEELYENVRTFLKEIIKKNDFDVKFITFNELLG
jgi:predicted deacetylase